MTDRVDFLGNSGSQPFELDATPVTRELFLGYIHAGYAFPDAVAEYIDNSMQQVRRAGSASGRWVKLSAAHDGSEFVLVVSDNGGGILSEDAVKLVRPGASGKSVADDEFSLFGIGGKIAGLSIAKRVVILSKAHGDPGFKVVLDRDEIEHKEDWRFRRWALPLSAGLKDGETRVYLWGVPSEVHAAFPNVFRDNFQKRYALLRGAGNPRIMIGESDLPPYEPESEMLSTGEAPDGCGPRKFTAEKTYLVGPLGGDVARHVVTFEAKIGLLPARSTIGQVGALIYCNDRLLGGYNELGLREGFELLGKRVHPQRDQSWLRAVVRIRGPRVVMPWTSRKDDLDQASPAYRDLREFLKQAYETFLDENVGPVRQAVRARSGSREFPDIIELLRTSYAAKLKSSTIRAVAVRASIAESEAFKRALELAKSNGVTPPPNHPTVTNLGGTVDVQKLSEARRIMADALGMEEVKNTELLRYMLDHFIRCVGRTPQSASPTAENSAVQED